MNSGSFADDFHEAHEPHWVLKSAFQLLVFGLIFTEALLALAVQYGFIWLAALLVIVVAHLMHGTLIGLHEAAHGLLRKSRRFNEFDGTVIGKFGHAGKLAPIPRSRVGEDVWPHSVN